MAALFIADLHLTASRPATLARFAVFLRDVPARGDRLYVLGDLFEYYAGDDDLGEAVNTRVVAALAAVAARGVALAWLAGNRDFLVGAEFARRAGMTPLAEPHALELEGTPALLMHGDTLCTGDTAYQEFRSQVRAPAWRAAFLARPLAERKAEIERLRAASEAEKTSKPAALMDVDTEAVAAAFSASGARWLIHGHTHRPARHDIVVAGRAATRWVLPEWDHRPGYLRADAGTMELVYLSPDH
jgi:UDP-2,3-diacylglucosamine hydrolase